MPIKNGNNDNYLYSFQVSDQIYFCGVPFRLDTYSGCSHKCLYCFARSAEITQYIRASRGQKVVPAIADDIKHTIFEALDTNIARDNIAIEWLRNKVPIHWGGMSDPFQPIERSLKVSLKCMEYLSWYNYPVIISTKGVLLRESNYLKLLKDGNYAVQVSLITDNNEIISNIEPGAPSASDRLNMLSELANSDIWTAVRIQPMIPTKRLEDNLPNYISKLSKAGVKHILVEAYKVQVRNNIGVNKIWQMFPDAINEYKYNDTDIAGFEMLLPSWRKWQYVKLIRDLCHQYHMTFGAADNDMRDLGDTVCCCGIDNLKGFENFWKYQASQAAQIAKQKGYVSLNDMQQFWHGTKGLGWNNDRIRESHRRIANTVVCTPKYAIDFMWKEGGPQSPECIASMKRDNIDSDIVYRYKNSIPTFESKQTTQITMF